MRAVFVLHSPEMHVLFLVSCKIHSAQFRYCCIGYCCKLLSFAQWTVQSLSAIDHRDCMYCMRRSPLPGLDGAGRYAKQGYVSKTQEESCDCEN